jgi:hypothetical protein
MMGSIDEVCEGLLEEAVHMWERDGALLTTAFAIGHARSLFAQPASVEGYDISDKARVNLHALLASTSGAVVVGRIDESYMKYVDIDHPPILKGDLSILAETDPTVRTCIAVQAINASHDDHGLVMIAILEYDDEGNAQWQYQSHTNAQGKFVEDARQSIRLADTFAIPTTNDQLSEQLRELGWVVADSDDMPTDYDEELE